MASGKFINLMVQIIVFVVIVIVLSMSSHTRKNYTNKVVLVGMDGLSSSSLRNTSLPGFSTLKNRSVYSLDVTTDDINLSGPNWVGILSGKNSHASGVHNNICRKPKVRTLFDMFSNAVYTQWSIIRCYTGTSEYVYEHSSSTDPNKMLTILNSSARFIFIHIDKLDSVGHAFGGNTEEYESALKFLDHVFLQPIINHILSLIHI